MNSICYKLKGVPVTSGIVFESWDTRKIIEIYLLHFKYLKTTKNFKNCEDVSGFYELVFSQKIKYNR